VSINHSMKQFRRQTAEHRHKLRRIKVTSDDLNLHLIAMLLLQCGRLASPCARCNIYCHSTVRYISRNAAIRKGLFAEKRVATAPPLHSRLRKPTRSSQVNEKDEAVRRRKLGEKGLRRNSQYEKDERVVGASGGFTSSHMKAKKSKFWSKESSTGKPQRGSKEDQYTSAEIRGRLPFSLPYTTAASEFLYGHSAVVAALKANRRQLYKLYIHPRASDKPVNSPSIEHLSRSTKVRVIHVDDRWLPLLDKAAKGRPHNVLQFEPQNKPINP